LLLPQLETISLDEAARLLLGERHAESNMRSQYFHFLLFMESAPVLSPQVFPIQLELIMILMLLINTAKVRRLYDIANVLSSLNLIEKVVS
jgi:transcription factor E2F7/8